MRILGSFLSQCSHLIALLNKQLRRQNHLLLSQVHIEEFEVYGLQWQELLDWPYLLASQYLIDPLPFVF